MQAADYPATNNNTECKFHCTNGRCLKLLSLICNHLNECGDNSDEEHCPASVPPPPDTIQSELEFVQIIIIIVVMTVMVVVIICLLNHYRLSAWAFLTRHSQARQREEGMQPVMYGPRNGERFNSPSFMQRDRFSRFQPTYPYLQQDIHLPPTICLSDGEELPPYKGPCTLQLRDPEQQLELSRASVRAPPNRTIFDSDLIDVYVHGGGPRPPSSNSGKSASNLHMEGPPPTYSEVMGQTHPGSASFLHQHSNNTPPSNQRTASGSAQPGASTTLLTKVKDSRRDKPM
ncbi:low-density lipoprotein receptor class A domain-containing protein 4-like isoform X2 [Carassius auratus]|uniref:Low-density lipoprotein receptor class A domain-containing protein 4-like isoform X2 n=1 Tax=Carassius auratus TaxID=7957 RepID=A0A6P6RG59_CARAU|nr:low-density lipoprotein receptor class A domain-containing protein 4-like isoform X2 [Carassius auratus]